MSRARAALGRWTDDRPGAGRNGAAACRPRGAGLSAARPALDLAAVRGRCRCGGPRPAGAGHPDAASTSRSGRRTCPSGWCCSSPRRGSARCWSTSTRPIGPFELQYVLKQSDAVALFLVDQFKSSDYFAMLAEVCPEIAAAKDGRVQQPASSRSCGTSSRSRARRRRAAHLGRRWSSAASRSPQRELDEHRPTAHARATPINIQYTSGTTGFPKAAMLSHRNLLLNAYYVGECQRFTDARPHLHSGAVLSLLRLRAGHAVPAPCTARR